MRGCFRMGCRGKTAGNFDAGVVRAHIAIDVLGKETVLREVGREKQRAPRAGTWGTSIKRQIKSNRLVKK